jgi:glycosyltransferase involved in cell wall biosynthesis
VRILVVSDLYPPVAFGGYESETAALVDGLRQSHEVHVLTSDRDAPAPVEGIVRALPYVGSRRREALMAPLKAARATRIARDELARFKPDVAYVANSVAIPQAAPLAIAATGVPVVYRFSELFMASTLYSADRYLRTLRPGQPGAHKLWSALTRLANRRLALDPAAHHRAAISWASHALRERVTLPGSIEPALERTIHPASTQEEVFATVARKPAGERSFLFLGRMTTAKGIEVAYRALAKLEGVHLVTVGTATPPMRGRLDALARELGVADRVDNRGRISTEELAEVLATVGAIILPTVEWDVFPLVLIEAGIARVPIVASRIGGVPEALEDGAQALLVEPGDADELAAALARTFDDPAAADERADRAHARMRELSVARYRDESERLIIDTAAALS